METFVIAVHVVVAVLLVTSVLIQSGKGTDMGSSFGGSANTVFGASGGGNFFAKITTVCAVIFMITSISLTVMKAKGGKKSLLEGYKPVAANTTNPAPVAAPVDAKAASSATPISTDSKDSTNAADKK